MTERFLLDDSVWRRLTRPAVRDVVAPLVDRGLVTVCAVVEMEFLHAARNAEDRDAIRDMLRGFEWLAANDEVWQRAVEVKCELTDRGNHRAVGIPDLVLAATAERHRVTVMHYDGDFDMIAAVTGQPTRWVVPSGTADA